MEMGERLRRKQKEVFLFCWTGYFLTYFGRLNLSVAMNAMALEFASGAAVIGLTGSVFFWVYAVGKLVNGYAGDYLDNRHQVFFGLMVSGAANVAIGFVHNIWIIILLWAVNGFAQSAIWCNMISLIAHWFYEEQHAGAAVWLSTSMVGGTLAGWGICGFIIRAASWQWVFLIPGFALILFALLWKTYVKNTAVEAGFTDFQSVRVMKPSAAFLEHTDSSSGIGNRLGKFILASGLIWIILACLAQGVIKDGIGLWGPTMIQDIYGVDAGTASFLLLFIPVMNFMGITLVGMIQRKRLLKEETLVVIMMILSVFILAGLRVFMGKSLAAGVLLLGGVSAVMYGVNTILLGVFPLRFARANRASFVSGLLDFCSYVAAGLSSVFSGLVIQLGLGWNSVFLVWLSLTVMGVGALGVFGWKYKAKTGR